MSKAIARLDEATQQLQSYRGATNTLELQMKKAEAIAKVEEALTDEIMGRLKQVQGHPEGWDADKDYTVPELRQVMSAALFRDIQPIGGELTILSGKPYARKPHFPRKFHELGIQWEVNCHPPTYPGKTKGNVTAHVEADVRWKFQGEESWSTFTKTYAVSVYYGKKPPHDLAVGLAEARAFRDIAVQAFQGDVPEVYAGEDSPESGNGEGGEVIDVDATPTRVRLSPNQVAWLESEAEEDEEIEIPFEDFKKEVEVWAGDALGHIDWSDKFDTSKEVCRYLRDLMRNGEIPE